MSRSKYHIKEIHYTLQGEGHHTGRPAIFCRFSGCNLWSGREEDRSTAICKFCDTDFWGVDGHHGGKYEASELVNRCSSFWPKDREHRYIVFTGGEPLLQLDEELIAAFKSAQFTIAIETNGTIEIPRQVDWVCMSPKANTEIVVRKGDELKLVYPQKNALPESFEHLEFSHFYLQPMDGDSTSQNIVACIEYCKNNPLWNLSLQTHKTLNIP